MTGAWVAGLAWVLAFFSMRDPRDAVLADAADQVASLRAALSVSAAAEEARRQEVDGLQRQLKEFQQEEAARFQHSLRQQAGQMRLRVRIGEFVRETV